MFIALEALLAFRFVLKILGTSIHLGFSNVITSISLPFATPFLTVFQVTDTIEGTFEWTTLMALFVYWVIATGWIRLLATHKQTSHARAGKVAHRLIQPKTA